MVVGAHLGLATVGAVIASRRPRHPVGWLLLLAFGVLGQAGFAVAGYADYGRESPAYYLTTNGLYRITRKVKRRPFSPAETSSTP